MKRLPSNVAMPFILIFSSNQFSSFVATIPEIRMTKFDCI